MRARCDEHVGEPYPPRCGECDAAGRREASVAILGMLDSQQIAALSYQTTAGHDLDAYDEAWQLAHTREQAKAAAK